MRESGVLSFRAQVVRALLHGYGAFIYVFLFAPIVLLVLFSFNANELGSFPITGWTTKRYSEAFGDYAIWFARKSYEHLAREAALADAEIAPGPRATMRW